MIPDGPSSGLLVFATLLKSRRSVLGRAVRVGSTDGACAGHGGWAGRVRDRPDHCRTARRHDPENARQQLVRTATEERDTRMIPRTQGSNRPIGAEHPWVHPEDPSVRLNSGTSWGSRNIGTKSHANDRVRTENGPCVLLSTSISSHRFSHT